MGTTIIILVILVSLIFAAVKILKNKKAKEKIREEQREKIYNYFMGPAISNGDFSKLNEASLIALQNFSKSISNNLSLLIVNHPEKVIDFINLKVDQEKREYLNKLIGQELNKNITITVNMVFAIWKQEKDPDKYVTVASYVVSQLEPKNQTTFARYLHAKAMAAGGSAHIFLKSFINDMDEFAEFAKK